MSYRVLDCTWYHFTKLDSAYGWRFPPQSLLGWGHFNHSLQDSAFELRHGLPWGNLFDFVISMRQNFTKWFLVVRTVNTKPGDTGPWIQLDGSEPFKSSQMVDSCFTMYINPSIEINAVCTVYKSYIRCFWLSWIEIVGLAVEVLFRQGHFFPDRHLNIGEHQEGAQNEPKSLAQVTDDTRNKLTTQICDVRKVLLHE